MNGDSSFWVEQSSEHHFSPMKRRRRKQRKLKFIGWGSKPLIQFLQSIGRDTSKPISRLDLEGIIDQYANARNLIQKKNNKKKRIICDVSLSALFGKKTVFRVQISKLLQTHLAEFHNSSEDDSQSDSEEQDDGAKNVDKQASDKGSGLSCQKTKVPVNCSAALCSDNLKLVYLKKSLVLDLLKAPESFEDKIIGSFVRVKADPNDYLQILPYQLLPVLGVRMGSEADNDKKVYLQLSNYVKEVAIEMLSDADFSEAECEDLRERVKAGFHRWPTFVEFEAKAGMLHRDIMKHWIPRQLVFLQNLINRANEKGWRRELFDHLEKRKLLEDASEQERLLLEIPNVVVDKLDPLATPPASIASLIGENDTSSPISYNWEACDNYYSDDAGSGDIKAPSAATSSNFVYEMKNSSITNGVASKESANCSGDIKVPSTATTSNLVVCEIKNLDSTNGVASKEALTGSGDIKVPLSATTSNLAVHEMKNSVITDGVASKEAVNDGQNSNVMHNGNAVGESISRGIQAADLQEDEVSLGQSERGVKETQIIELSDDDEPKEVMENDITVDTCIWCYVDPLGIVQGPFALADLMLWYQCNYFHPEFKVWRNGESLDQAKLLVDVLRAFYSL